MTVTQFIAKRSGLGKRHAKKLLETGDVLLNHQPITDSNLPLGRFDRLTEREKSYSHPPFPFPDRLSRVFSARGEKANS